MTGRVGAAKIVRMEGRLRWTLAICEDCGAEAGAMHARSCRRFSFAGAGPYVRMAVMPVSEHAEAMVRLQTELAATRDKLARLVPADRAPDG
jgi:hypothetical protein